MNLIQLQNGQKAFGGQALFKDATFAINEDEHVGVIGPNGAGKTTLFKILTNREELDDGEVIRSRSLRIGYLEQEVEWEPDETLEDYLSKCSMAIWELKQLGRGLGLDEEKFSVPISSLSGGYRMRCKLLYLIGTEPNLMLLDEPTNYLDLETLLVLEKFLQNFRGAFMVISHDREFLRRVTDHTLEVESQEITKYPGNIDDYFEEKEMLREQMEKQAMSVAAKRKAILDFAARFGAKASKARQAQSKLKSLRKLEPVELRPLPVSARINIPEPTRIGKKAIALAGTDLGYGEKTILRSVDLNLVRGNKVAIVGFNGVGKSTLLKGLAKILEPQSGSVDYGMSVEIGYYAQHVTDELEFDNTVYEELQKAAHVDVTKQEVLDMAGSLLFSGDMIDKKIAKLSGGEKARVALGKILLRKVPVLILDEVTNHLDFGTVESLTQSLKDYNGTLVLVSHDRGFVARIATKILEIRDGKVLEFHGSYDEYVWSLEKGALSEYDPQNSGSNGPEQISTDQKSPNRKHRRKELQTEIRSLDKKSKELELKINKAQSRLEELSSQLHQESSPNEELLKELGSLPHDLIELEEMWMAAIEKKDLLTKELESLRN